MSGPSASAAPSTPARWTVAGAFGVALAVAAVVVVADQASKWAILEVVMQPPRTIEVTGFFNLVLTFNPGVSFGLLGGAAAWKPWLLATLAIGIVAALLHWLRRQPEPLLALAIGLISGGAVGNTIDRLRHGGVVDFLDFHLGDWHWWVFNLADTAVATGVAMLVLDGLFLGRQGSKT